ncbi:unnamed protein product [Brassica oleracea]
MAHSELDLEGVSGEEACRRRVVSFLHSPMASLVGFEEGSVKQRNIGSSIYSNGYT